MADESRSRAMKRGIMPKAAGTLNECMRPCRKASTASGPMVSVPV